jgi:hypothetical protein
MLRSRLGLCLAAILASLILAQAGSTKAGYAPASFAPSGVAAEGASEAAALFEFSHHPTGAAAEAVARHLLAAVPAEAFARRLAEQASLPGEVLPVLGGVLASAARPFADELATYLATAARARARQLARRGSWSAGDLASLLALMVIDPARFASEAAFHARVLAVLPGALGGEIPARLRAEALTGLNHLPGFGFADGERLAVAWGEARQDSASRRLDYATAGPGLLFSADDDPIAASVYSLPSSYFETGEVVSLLAAVHALAPRRELLVLTDLPLARRLAPRVSSLRVDLLDTWGRSYSPWPRDPFSFTHLASGALVVLVRPNVQRSREEDLHLGPALVDALPAALDRAWGAGEAGVRWTESPVPFHNGQVLLTHDTAWISLHTLEPRVLALLGLDRVPVESFASTGGIARYVAAARRAAAELEHLYRRPVRFVHPLPEAAAADADGAAPAPLAGAASPPARAAMPAAAATPATPAAPSDAALMQRIGGGAGYDLDSLLTLLPEESGPGASSSRAHVPVALVASLAAGKRLLAASSGDDFAALRRGYGLAPAPEALRATLSAAQESPRAAGLESFLDLVAEHLAGQGFQVRRLPLLAIPTTLLAGENKDAGYPEFLLTWNNVVLEARPGKPLRAEGFAALLPRGDAEARRLFSQAGCHLDLLPPLVFSTIRNGGYRCASNQVRQAARPRHGDRRAPTGDHLTILSYSACVPIHIQQMPSSTSVPRAR